MCNFIGSQRPDLPDWPPEIQITRIQYFSFRDKAAGADHDTIPNDDFIHNDAAHADKAFMTDPAAVQDDSMANGYPVPDQQICAIRVGIRPPVADMEHTQILNVGLSANANEINVSPNNSAAPNRRFIADVNVTDHLRAGM